MTKPKAKADNIQEGKRVLGGIVDHDPESLDALAQRYGLPNGPPEYPFRDQFRKAASFYWLADQWQNPEVGHRGSPSDQKLHFQALENAAIEMEKALQKLTADRQYKLQKRWGQRPPYGDPSDTDWVQRMLADARALKWAAHYAPKDLPQKYGDDAWRWFLRDLVRIWGDSGKEVPSSITYNDVGDEYGEPGRDQYPQEIAQFVIDCARLAEITPEQKSDAAIGRSLKRLFEEAPS
ncbi:hypothetical protein [Halorhodospira neutriphila]|uniref:Uncharacterized protein n=1 Tax=Halorhodospira neutriphila TaxID=168379 RepID=A0ABS1E6Q4_9GAMM|nr:hypothetical protein [Halorhodospira neutriphila]MBK1726802.1 hypothetical protein [Halorhodospira neutriphila]